VPEDWWYFPVVARLHNERTGYPTQKPEGLIERILLASSNPGDLVADFFCGSGTLPTVAARLDRRFLACDATFRAVHTTRCRLAAKPGQPFRLDRDSVAPFPLAAAPASLRIDILKESVRVQTDLSLDYWELDPAWDGITFRSAGQAVRAGRSAEIPSEIKIETGGRLCLRLVTTGGEQFQVELGGG
jgi:hypothetical protein